MVLALIFIGAAAGVVGKAWYDSYTKHDSLAISRAALKRILVKKDLWNVYKNGELYCPISGEVLTEETLGFVELFKSNGSVLIVSKDGIPSFSNMTRDRAKELAY